MLRHVTLFTVVSCLALLAFFSQTTVAEASYPACNSSHFNPGTALNHGTFKEFRCTVTSGSTYSFAMNYTSCGGDCGNYVGMKLYRDSNMQYIMDSGPNGPNRESMTQTAGADEIWYIKIENLATGPSHNTTFGVIGGLE